MSKKVGCQTLYCMGNFKSCGNKYRVKSEKELSQKDKIKKVARFLSLQLFPCLSLRLKYRYLAFGKQKKGEIKVFSGLFYSM